MTVGSSMHTDGPPGGPIRGAAARSWRWVAGLLASIALGSLGGWTLAHGQSGELRQDVLIDLEYSLATPFSPGEDQSWCPVELRLKNLADRPRTLRVELRGGERWQQQRGAVTWTVDLPPGGEVRRMSAAYVGNNRWGGEALRLQLLEDGQALIAERGGEVLIQRRVSTSRGQRSAPKPVPSQIPFNTVNVLLVAADRSDSTLNLVEDAFSAAVRDLDRSRQVQFRVATPAELPLEIEAYEAIDRIVVYGVDPEDLTESRRRALRSAVRRGSYAWIVPAHGGEGMGWVLPAGVAGSIERVEGVLGLAEVELFRLPEESGRPLGVLREVEVGGESQQVVAAYAYADGLGEWRRLAIRSGTRFPFAVDLKRSWTATYWSCGDDLQSQHPEARSAVDWIREVDSLLRVNVSTLLVFGLIVTYVLGVGPVLFLVLKRMDKLIWLLWLQPAVVTAFLVITWTVGFINFGAFTRSYQTLVLVQPRDRTSAYGLSLLTRYNPRQGGIDLRTRAGVSPLPAMRSLSSSPIWEFGEDGGLRDFALAEWSYAHFLTGGSVDLRGQVRVKRRLELDAEAGLHRERVQVTNGLPFALRNPILRVNRRIRRFGLSISPGDSVIIDESTAQLMADDPTRALGRAVFSSQPDADILFELAPGAVNAERMPFVIEAEYEHKGSHAYLLTIRGEDE